jgi:hypothetical protein
MGIWVSALCKTDIIFRIEQICWPSRCPSGAGKVNLFAGNGGESDKALDLDRAASLDLLQSVTRMLSLSVVTCARVRVHLRAQILNNSYL